MSFDFAPVLEGGLVVLRPLRATDEVELYRVAADPLLWELHPARRRSDPDEFHTFFQDSLRSGGALVILDRSRGEIIGSSRFHAHDPDASEVEIGWTFLARDYWGGAYNREVKELMFRHAFRFVRRIVMLIAASNTRSRRAAEKVGATLSGERPDSAGRPSLCYEVSASQYDAWSNPSA